MSKKNVYAVVPASGKGKRLGSKTPKAHLSVAGKPLFIHTLRALKRAYPFRRMMLVVDTSRLARARRELARHGLGRVWLTAGGATRAESVRNGLLALGPGEGLVAVHDAARPLVSAALVRRTIQAAQKSGGAICVLPVSSTVKRLDPRTGRVRGTEDRRHLALAQTPQVFEKALLLSRYRALGERAYGATDEAALFDGTRLSIRAVEGEERNLKVTTRADLDEFKRSLRSRG